MLEKHHGKHITTASLAKAVGVSEAALYRYFSSKAQMFEALIDFIEESLLSHIELILEQGLEVGEGLYRCMVLMLGFAEKNAGIARIINGDVLTGETQYLRLRVNHLFDNIEKKLLQFLQNESETEARVVIRLLLAVSAGRINQFVRSNFRERPLAGWPQQWRLLRQGLAFKTAEPADAN